MNDINFKNYGTMIIVVAIIALIVSLIPLFSYYLAFKDFEISERPADWSSFGSYLSGSVGVLLSFFAVVFTLISIYFTTRIAKYIQDKDFDFRTKQAGKELQITYSQSKPFPYIDLQRLPKLTTITIQNMGLGPLNITEISIVYKKVETFANVNHLFENKLNILTKGTQIIYNSAPTHILAPNSSKSILQINPIKENNEINENNENFKLIQSECRNILKDCEVFLSYEDIFGNKFEYNKELSFLSEEPNKKSE
jgi:hypothetical protein